MVLVLKTALIAVGVWGFSIGVLVIVGLVSKRAASASSVLVLLLLAAPIALLDFVCRVFGKDETHSSF